MPEIQLNGIDIGTIDGLDYINGIPLGVNNIVNFLGLPGTLSPTGVLTVSGNGVSSVSIYSGNSLQGSATSFNLPGASISNGVATLPVVVDLLVVGGTTEGVFTAVEAARRGLSVAIIEEFGTLGGMVTGGLCYTDALIGADPVCHDRMVVGEFYEKVRKLINAADKLEWLTHYSYATQPGACTQALWELIDGLDIQVYLNEYISPNCCTFTADSTGALTVISSVTTNERTFAVRAVSCASYTGDLLRYSGADFVIGREGTNSVTAAGLTIAADPGANVSGFNPGAYSVYTSVNPYTNATDASAGYCKGIWVVDPGSGSVVTNGVIGGTPYIPSLTQGAADINIKASGNLPGYVPAMCYRLYMTTASSRIDPNTLPVVNAYDSTNYELLGRIATASGSGWTTVGDIFFSRQLNGGTTYDWNKKVQLGLNFVDPMCTEYLTAGHDRRVAIRQYIKDWTLGLLRFCKAGAPDPLNGGAQRIPTACKNDFSNYGFSAAEFKGNGGFSDCLYVREGPRMVGDFIYTQANLLRSIASTQTYNDPGAMAYYAVDGHPVMRLSPSTNVADEGQLAGSAPTAGSWVPQRVMFPKRAQITNMTVSVCISCTHISWCSLRVEPTMMYHGAMAGVITARYLQRGLAAIQDTTDANGFNLDVRAASNLFGSTKAPNGQFWEALIGIDGGVANALYSQGGATLYPNTAAWGTLTGQVSTFWDTPAGTTGILGAQAVIVPHIYIPGRKAVYLQYQAGGTNRSNRVPVTIKHAGGIDRLYFNPNIDLGGSNYGVAGQFGWLELGIWTFNANAAGSVGVVNNLPGAGVTQTASTTFGTPTFGVLNLGGDYVVNTTQFTDNLNHTITITDPNGKLIGTIVVADGGATGHDFTDNLISFTYTSGNSEVAANHAWVITIVNTAPAVIIAYNNTNTAGTGTFKTPFSAVGFTPLP